MPIIGSDFFTRPGMCNLSNESQLIVADAWAGADNEGCFNILPALKYRNLNYASDAFIATTSKRNIYTEPPLIILCDGIVYASDFLEKNKSLLTSIAFKPSSYRKMLFERYPIAIKFEENYLLSEYENCAGKSKRTLIERRLRELRLIDIELDLKTIEYLPTLTQPNRPTLEDFEKFIVDNSLFFDYEQFWNFNDGCGWKGSWQENCRKFAGRYAYQNPNEHTPKYAIKRKVEEFVSYKRKNTQDGNL